MNAVKTQIQLETLTKTFAKNSCFLFQVLSLTGLQTTGVSTKVGQVGNLVKKTRTI